MGNLEDLAAAAMQGGGKKKSLLGPYDVSFFFGSQSDGGQSKEFRGIISFSSERLLISGGPLSNRGMGFAAAAGPIGGALGVLAVGLIIKAVNSGLRRGNGQGFAVPYTECMATTNKTCESFCLYLADGVWISFRATNRLHVQPLADAMIQSLDDRLELENPRKTGVLAYVLIALAVLFLAAIVIAVIATRG